MHRFRLFIGPRYYPTGHAYHYDWSGIQENETFGNVDLDESTTLSASLSAAAATVALTANTHVQPSGGVWVRAAGDITEYIGYSGRSGSQRTLLTGLVRDTSAQHDGQHPAGAIVSHWVEVTDNNGELQFSEDLDGPLVSSTWEARVSGSEPVAAVLRPQHLACVMRSEWDAGAGAYTPYRVALLGITANPTQSTRAGNDDWSLAIKSIDHELGRANSPGTRAGTLDFGPNSTARSATPLGDPAQERNRGYYVAAAPDVSAAATVDGNRATVAILDRVLGLNEWRGKPANYASESYPQASTSHVTGMMINPPAGQGKGGRWLEFFDDRGGGIGNVEFYAYTYSGNVVQENFKLGDTEDRQLYIVAENAERFAQLNPTHGAANILEAEHIFESLDPRGGALIYREGGNVYTSPMMWGTVTSWPSGKSPFDRRTWQGAALPAPKAGEVFRFRFNPAPSDPQTMKNWWRVDSFASPAYHPSDSSSRQFFMWALPRIGLSLAEDITFATPGTGGQLRLVDASGQPSVNGIGHGGDLIIGGEGIRYSGKTYATGAVTVSERGLLGSERGPHKAGDAAYIRVAEGVITDGIGIEELRFRFPDDSHATKFRVYVSDFVDTPRLPGSANNDLWDRDWVKMADESSSSEKRYEVTFPARRVTHVLLVIDRMSENPGRAKVAEFQALPQLSAYDSSQYLTPRPGGNVLHHILQRAGIPGPKLGGTVQAGNVEGIATEPGNTWDIARDLAEYLGYTLHVNRDSAVVYRPDDLRTATPTPGRTFDRVSVAEWQHVKGLQPVSQVRLTWRAPGDGEGEQTVKYPAEAIHDGRALDIGTIVYPDAATAYNAARKRFFTERAPYTVVVRLMEGDWTLATHGVVRVDWAGRGDVEDVDRLYLIEGCQHTFERDRTLTTTLHLRQIEWESYR